MATSDWSVPTGKTINGSTKIKDTDNHIADTIQDLVDWCNNTNGTFTDWTSTGLRTDFVDKGSSQIITGAKTFSNPIVGNVTGNASTATTLETARTITVSGDVSGSVSFNGSGDVDIDTDITTSLLGKIYPIGSVYINASSTTNPSTLLGFGTWVEIGAGKVLVGQDTGDSIFDTMEETGGSKNAIAVSHSHTFSGTTSANGRHSHTYTEWYSQSSYDGGNLTPVAYRTGTTSEAPDHTHTYSGTTSTTGSSGTNANIQPYLVVKMWKRTA